MKKKHSKGRFVVIAVLCAILAFFTIFGFSISKDSDFVGFARAINLGVEYKGGTVKEYSIENSSINKDNIGQGISNNATRIKYLLDNEGYETNAYQNGGNLVIEFVDDYSPVDIEEIINKKITFGMKTSQSETAENVITASDVKEAYSALNGTQNVVYIIFTDEGATNFRNQLSNNTLYVYINSNFIYSISNDNVSTYALTGFTAPSLDSAKNYASQIMSSKYDFTFTEVNSTTYSKEVANKNVITLISLVVGVFALCSIMLIALFKKLGLAGALTLFVGLLLQILLLQAIPETVFVFTSTAMFASLLALVLGTLSIYMFYDKMHKEYKMGKVLYASVKFGYNKMWATVIDLFVVLLAPSIVTYFVGTYMVKQFALAFITGLVVYGVITIVLTKFFAKWMTYISVKNKDYGLQGRHM